VGRPRVADDLLAPFVAAPQRAGVLSDFDGTLSPIVEDPDRATPLAGVPEILDALAHRYRRVAVLSGRPVAFLQAVLPRSVLLSGLYGLETVDRGVRRDHPQSGSWREVVDDVASLSEARGPAGMRVERKGLSLTLHYRSRPEAEPEVRAWADRQAARSGLVSRPARKSYELHPPIPADKGTAVHQLCAGLGAALFLGDDVGDLPAYDALDQLAGKGMDVVKVAVRSSEAPPALLDRADLVVDGPQGAADLLRRLLVPVPSPG
jgi:trehalose 6-phosphate phosphatase